MNRKKHYGYFNSVLYGLCQRVEILLTGSCLSKSPTRRPGPFSKLLALSKYPSRTSPPQNGGGGWHGGSPHNLPKETTLEIPRINPSFFAGGAFFFSSILFSVPKNCFSNVAKTHFSRGFGEGKIRLLGGGGEISWHNNFSDLTVFHNGGQPSFFSCFNF